MKRYVKIISIFNKVLETELLKYFVQQKQKLMERMNHIEQNSPVLPGVSFTECLNM